MTGKISVGFGVLVALIWAAAGQAGESVLPKAPEGKTRATTIVSAAPADAAREARVELEAKGDWTLKEVLDFLSTKSGLNIRCLDDKAAETKITLTLRNVSWREMLNVLAEKYGLIVDSSKEAAGIILVKSPPKVTISNEKPMDIRVVISTISASAGANIIIGPEVKGDVSVSLTDVPWDEALQMVVRTLNFVAVKDKFNTYRITTPDKLAQQLETRFIPLSYIQPEGVRYAATITSEFVKKEAAPAAGAAAAGADPISLLGTLKSMASAGGKISYIRERNTLVITDTPTKLEAMQKLIEALDVAPKQVHLTVRMIELSDTESEELGVEWANGFIATLSGMSFGTMFPFSPSGHTPFAHTFPGRYGVATKSGDVYRSLGDPRYASSADAGVPKLGTMDFTGLQATLHFVKTRTRGTIIQSPSITALDNQEATIHVGDNIRYAEFYSDSTQGAGTASGYREAAGSPIKAGIQLLVVPHVTGPDGNVLMTVIVKAEDLVKFQDFGTAGNTISLPQTNQRVVVTQELLRDSETGVIGGLKKNSSLTQESKVPFLGDIPGVRWLFSSRIKPALNNYQNNLLIFVTPAVVDLQREDRVSAAVREIQRAEASRFFTYDDKPAAAGAEAPAAGPR